MGDFRTNEPTQLQRDRMRLETRYLIIIIAALHALYILNLISNHLAPHEHEDFGSTLLFIILLIVNIHLYDESKCYHYCFWHRLPISFSIYYECSRILWDLDIIKWSAVVWNLIDGITLVAVFSIWILGYLFTNHPKH